MRGALKFHSTENSEEPATKGFPFGTKRVAFATDQSCFAFFFGKSVLLFRKTMPLSRYGRKTV
jgi:hypothetical protein